jgi:uncharacterized membrane protein YkoI
MRVALTVVFLSSALAGPGAAQEPATKETKETLKSLPPQVREAVLAQSRGATLRGVAKETQNGVTLYEVETIAHGRTRDIMLDAQGKLVSVEEQTTLGEIPEKARAAILRSVGTRKLVLVEKVTKGDTTFYEGHIHDGRSLSEVKVDAAGKPVE